MRAVRNNKCENTFNLFTRKNSTGCLYACAGVVYWAANTRCLITRFDMNQALVAEEK